MSRAEVSVFAKESCISAWFYEECVQEREVWGRLAIGDLRLIGCGGSGQCGWDMVNSSADRLQMPSFDARPKLQDAESLLHSL